ncbi:type I restriction endonuclease subunit R [Methanomethylophilus alvi]|uniref:type I restriction endonuclease subunit R n=1 Tax=Methanomethylophilus alvi TaxID=1291540 RepID=UPI0037DC3742
MSGTQDFELSEEEISEFETRKRYIDEKLRDAGWVENHDWIDEYELEGMPNASNVGYADYVLFKDDGYPLAVVEAKRTSKDPSAGRHQAKLYADLLEKKFHKRPVIFLTNGFETRILDDRNYQERKVWGIYCKRDLEKLFNLSANREKNLSDATIKDGISDRYYQKGAIKAVCSAFEKKQRKALLVMATGSGKTRTIISLVDVMLRKGWIRNVLFLADRTSLVSQAADNFTKLLPSLSTTNLCKNNCDTHARCVLSTYQTMINLIDDVREKDNTRTFSNGHFDLIIVDEAHRSIYNKYREIFDYFDGLLVGLTATPKDDIDKNTYEVFNLEKGIPTYGYELAQAVSDGFLVDYRSVEVETKFLDRGVVYVDLTPEEKDEYEELFIGDEVLPEKIESQKINKWLFNRDTVVRVLDTLMRMGLKIKDGSVLGKTIIFARNHEHAEFIREVFNEQYPSHLDECQVIDNYYSYADNMIDKFKDPESTVRIAVSVDMMDTGIDVPDILNLVFFKPVYSKSKFWQMIGRGTRLCPGLIDGEDKDCFYIFDFCRNFEFFRVNPKGISVKEQDTIQGRIFTVKALVACKLQELGFRSEPYISFRKDIVADLKKKIDELNKDNFAVIQHLRAVEHYSRPEVLDSLTLEDVAEMEAELSHLILPYDDDPGAIRMDALMLMIERGYITDSPKKMLFKKVRHWADALSKQMVIPDVADRRETIEYVLRDGYLENGDLETYERIRVDLRDIMKYIPSKVKSSKKTNFIDEILSIDINPSELTDEGLSSYRERAEHYIRTHEDEDVIKKLKTNVPLDDGDVEKLQEILWSEVGTIDDYQAEYGNKPLALFIREITGLDMNAAKKTFSKYLDESRLDDKQIHFVNQIIEYVVRNGAISDLSVLTESPFTNYGTIPELFSDMSIWSGIRSAIKDINSNAGIN